MIDLHCHLDLYPVPKDVVERCRLHRVFVVSVTTTPSAFRGTAALADHDDTIETAVGLHPQLAAQRHCELDLFDDLLASVVWVGEIGLDGSAECKSFWHVQQRVFEHCLASCTASGGKLMSIHSRLAATDVLNVLKRFPDSGTPVLHWFSGTPNELSDAVSAGCWFSVGLPMLRSRKGRDLVSRIPRDRVLTETDGPFVRNGGAPAVPWEVGRAENELASLWKASLYDTREVLAENLTTLTGRGRRP